MAVAGARGNLVDKVPGIVLDFHRQFACCLYEYNAASRFD